MPISKLRNDSGFTLIETILAISMSFIVISMGYMFLHFTQVCYKKWQQQEQGQRKQHVINKLLYNDILNAKTIVDITPVSLLLEDQENRMIFYQYQDSILYRNDHPLHDKQNPIIKFCFLGDKPGEFYSIDDFTRQTDYYYNNENDLISKETGVYCVQYHFEMRMNNSPHEFFAVINLRNQGY